MVTEGERVKVLDFGIAQGIRPALDPDATTRTGSPLSGAGDIAGTLPYMSPEQATGRQLDGRSDMFSLGVVLRAPGARRPFEENGAQVLESLLQRIGAAQARLDDLRLPAIGASRRMLERPRRAATLICAAVEAAATQRGETLGAEEATAGLP
jgi:hypothetical protein